MNDYNLMQQALGEQWQQLPTALQAHYQAENNIDVGELDIEYPTAMQPLLNMLRLLGTLINRRDKAIPTTVEKRMVGQIQHWERTLSFPSGKHIKFKSHWEHIADNLITEFVSPMLGLCMSVHVKDGKLYYEGRHFVFRLGSLQIKIPEWLLMGHTTIIEEAVDDEQFTMDFRLHHPLFGQIYRYAGRFRTERK